MPTRVLDDKDAPGEVNVPKLRDKPRDIERVNLVRERIDSNNRSQCD
jgi:hypothetical protein